MLSARGDGEEVVCFDEGMILEQVGTEKMLRLINRSSELLHS